MQTETATATNPTEATPSTTPAAEAAATLLAGAGEGTGTTQQTPPAETPAATTEEKPAGEPTKTETASESKAPENYTFTAPEGKEYDPTLLESFSGAAKEAGLPQEVAQKLLDTMAPVLVTRQAEQVQAIHTQWTEASKTDKEFGGDKLMENLAVARKAYDKFATPELRTLLDTTGMGNHPEVIRMMFRVGKAISEDTLVVGRAGRSDDGAKSMYPNSNMS